MSTVVPRKNNNIITPMLYPRQTTVVPSQSNNSPNSLKPRNNVIGYMLKRQPTTVIETGGKRKTRRNKKLRKTRRSHKK